MIVGGKGNVEIRWNAMEAHTIVDGDWRESGSSCSLSIASNEGVPCEGFNGRVSKMKSWMSRGDER